MHAPRWIRSLRPLPVLVALFSAGSAAAWSGERALTLAERLDVEIAATVSAAEGGPVQDSVRAERQRGAALSEVPGLEHAVAELVRALRAGGDRESTRSYYEKIRKSMDAVVSSANDNTPRKSTADRWQKANATLHELGLLYAEP